MTIKTYIYLFIALVIVGLSTTIFFLNKANEKNKALYEIESNNFKADIAANNGQIRTYKLTIDQIKTQNDAITHKLDSVRRASKIKDKKLLSMQYTLDSISKKDTVIFKDTIFRDPSFALDTTIRNKHYSLELNLRAPSTIIVTPTFINERYILFEAIRETIAPKKKWPCYWFQKKQTVVNITIKDSNPYIVNNKSRFVEVIK